MATGSRPKYLISTGLAMCLLAGAAQAQSGESVPASQPPLDSIDVRNRADADGAPELGVDFSFRGEQTQEDEPEFLYLEFETAEENNPPPAIDAAGFTPRSTASSNVQAVLNARGLSRAARTFTPRYAGAAVSLGTTGVMENMPLIDISLSSHYSVSGTELAPLSGIPDLLTPLDRQFMDVGLSVGYSGFHFDASLTRESGGFESGYEGVNLGLGYAWSDFSTQISVGDYSALESGISLAGLTDHGGFQKLELGAAYAVSERLRFSGGVRLFDYSKRLGLTGQPERSGVLYLGTRLNF